MTNEIEVRPGETGFSLPQALGCDQPVNSHRTFALYAFLAILIAVPCVWQSHIQADDLSSHLYNAWLVNEVSAGHLKGLYVVPQFTNVLFDHVLSFLLKTTGSVVITERVAVIAAVQIFFWGCFAFVSAVAGRRAWSIIPFLLMLTYGAVFRLGFFNFYVSVGICLWAIALVWQNRPRLRLLAIPLLLLAFTAHFLPVVWTMGVIGCMLLLRRLPVRYYPWFTAASLLTLLAFAALIKMRVPARWVPGIGVDSLSGVDQLLTFGAKYKTLAAVLLCLWIFLLVRRCQFRSPVREIAFHVWILTGATCLLMPDSLWTPLYTAGLWYITIRLSLLCAILFCAVVAVQRIPWAAQVFSVMLALAFFSFTFMDERGLNGVEEQVGRVVKAMPAGTRFISTLRVNHLYVQALEHVLGRPCIGHCFDYGNYEASTTQFRLRAREGNIYVVSDYREIGAFQHDILTFYRTDLSLYRLFEGRSGEISSAPVQPGERLPRQDIGGIASSLDRFIRPNAK